MARHPEPDEGRANAASDEPTEEDPLLSVRDLRTRIDTDDGPLFAVDGVSFDVDSGETVCLVGESGSGKSVTCESLTGIVPQPPAEIVGGSVAFDGRDLSSVPDSELRAVRGRRIGHVFQNPSRALDPVYTVGEQVAEPIAIHEDVSRADARERAVDLLRRVGIPRADRRADDYPHEFSGGMQQRVAIATALAADPDLVIADEPTTAVDVTVQARLLDLFRELGDGGTGLLLVTHDLRVVAAAADRVVVMYGGTVVERGPVESVFADPAHPYTQALFDSHGTDRRVGGPARARSADDHVVRGNSPTDNGRGNAPADESVARGNAPADEPVARGNTPADESVARGNAPADESVARGDVPTDGCRFRKECPYAVEACAGGEQPSFRAVAAEADRHVASCVHYAPDGDASEIRAHAASLAASDRRDRNGRGRDADRDTAERGDRR
ncbi:ABC transporter ATP-binding protein [Halorubrum ejinorense]|uniref:Nickel import system ATP-binding protein NikD n=1 Tax=Halorubrum ejinorense TaxID=425309 RepID=A0AAV3SUM8_9EURY